MYKAEPVLHQKYFSCGHIAISLTFLFFIHSGHDVVIVKSGKRICGTGAALANAPIVQNKAYFEIKLQCSGNFSDCCPHRVVSHHERCCSVIFI